MESLDFMDTDSGGSFSRSLMSVDTWRERGKDGLSTSIQGEGILVIITLGLGLIAMAGDWIGPEIVLTFLLGLWTTAGILTVNQAAAGYGNTGLLTVMFLYCVAEGIYQTGGLEPLMVKVMGRSRSTFWGLVRMMVPVMCLSAFLNNTPIVALMIPILQSWSRRTGVPVKKMLIPMSFAAIFGGTCTLIGTTTNLVVSGLQSKRYANDPASVKFEIFDISPYGIPYAIWGTVFVWFTQSFLLPGHTSKHAKNLLMAMRVLLNSSVNGKTLADSGLMSMQSTKMVAVSRNGALIMSPPIGFVLEVGDVLYMAGELGEIEFYGEDFGLEMLNHTNEHLTSGFKTSAGSTDAPAYGKLVQVTLLPESSLVGQTLAVAEFPFEARVIAIKRGNGRSDSALRDVVLAAGDILVIDTGNDVDLLHDDVGSHFTKVHLIKDGLTKEFIAGFLVEKGAPVANQSIHASGLCGIPGLAVLTLDRSTGEKLEAVDNATVINAGDTIWVAADMGNITFLTKFPGLKLVQQRQVEKTDTNILYRKFIQAAVAPRGNLVGKTVREAKFRQKYNAAVVAIHRDEARVPLRVEDVVLQAGDVMLIEATDMFLTEFAHDKAFLLLLEVPNSSPLKKNKAWIAAGLAVAMILTQIIHGLIINKNETYANLLQDRLYRGEMIHLWIAAIMTTILMIALGCMTAKQAKQSMMWDIYLVIAAAFGVSTAMEVTGVAKAFAEILIDIADYAGGGAAVLIAIYIATALLTEILTNNAAAAVMYPIAAIACDEMGLPARDASIAIMLGASAAFINPFGYQCNYMVMIAGNYRWIEFARIGLPLQLFMFVVSGFVLVYIDEWTTIWAISFSAVGAILAIALAYTLIPARHTLPIEAWISRKLKAVGAATRRYLFTPVRHLAIRMVAPCRRFVSESVAGDRTNDGKRDSGAFADLQSVVTITAGKLGLAQPATVATPQ